MYYRINGQPVVEGYDKETLKDPVPKSVFPLWLLLVIVVAIITCGLWFLLCLRKKEGEQDFGFQFY